jgi:epoxyqueuosine reductase
MDLKGRIRTAARALGFERVGFAAARDLGPAAGIEHWLSERHHGTMSWMARDPARRRDPRRLEPSARTVVSLAANYYHPAVHAPGPGIGRISRYAWGGDYHRILKRRLAALLTTLRGEGALRGGAAPRGSAAPRHDARESGARIAVDTAPVAEKAWAHQAGVGWVGKHSNVITRDRGSWVFLAELLLDVELEPDPPAADHCGTCTRCLDACPTQAIVAPAVVDSRRCISYLTIELRGAIAPELRAPTGDWIFGCDICQDVCPWNKFSRPSADVRFGPRPGQEAPRLAELAQLREEEFAVRFQGTNLRRPGWRGFLRNVMVALGNDRSPAASTALAAGLEHPAPLVRQHAAWGLGQKDGPRERAALRRQRERERDPEVRSEIDSALGQPIARSAPVAATAGPGR